MILFWQRCLLKTQKNEIPPKSVLVVTACFIIFASLLIALLLGATAHASESMVQDRRLNMDEAKAMATQAQTKNGFPVVVNDQVLKYLNHFIGTPRGRKFMRETLARMKNYKVILSNCRQKYEVPDELLAIPIIESNYRSLSRGRSKPSKKPAGLWQFVPRTAKNYGLRVDSQNDERLDVALSTDAAMRHLRSTNLRFKDWHLAILAYNMGEHAVNKLIASRGSRDAWTLISNSKKGDKNYLPKLMAAILIMRNPESVQ